MEKIPSYATGIQSSDGRDFRGRQVHVLVKVLHELHIHANEVSETNTTWDKRKRVGEA